MGHPGLIGRTQHRGGPTKKQDLISGATLIATGLAGQGAIAGSYGADDLIVAVEGPAEPDLIVYAPADTELDGFLPPIVDAELHYTFWGGGGDDMVRVPGTELRKVTGPQGREVTVQVNRRTREVFSFDGEKIDPPRWMIEQLRDGQ